MSRSILMGCVAAACLLCGGCATGRPIRYYALNVPPVSTVENKPNGLVLLVGRIAAPPAIEDGRIHYRSGGNEVGSYEYDRWTESPTQMVRDLLIRTLLASGKYRQVQEASSAVAGDYLIRGRLEDFSELDSPGIQSRVSLAVAVIERKSGLLVWEHSYSRDLPVAGKAMKDVVASLDRNLQQVMAEAASGIEGFLAGRS